MLDRIRKYRGVFESPSARRIEETPLYREIATIPRQVVLI